MVRFQAPRNHELELMATGFVPEATHNFAMPSGFDGSGDSSTIVIGTVHATATCNSSRGRLASISRRQRPMGAPNEDAPNAFNSQLRSLPTSATAGVCSVAKYIIGWHGDRAIRPLPERIQSDFAL